MKTEQQIKEIASSIAEENSEFVERGFSGTDLASKIRINFGVWEQQEKLTDQDKTKIFLTMYDNEPFRTIDVVEQSLVSILELRTMMELCGVKTYTIRV